MFEPTVVPESDPGSVVPGWVQDPGWELDLDAGEFEPSDAEVDEAFAEMWAVQRGLTGPGEATVAVADAVASLGGVELAGFLLGLPDRSAVDGWTVVEAMKGWEKVIRFAQGQQISWVAELGQRRPAVGSKWARGGELGRDLDGSVLSAAAAVEVGDDARACAAEVGLALDLARVTAQGLLVDAFRLARELPATLRALHNGDLSLRSARVVAAQTCGLSLEQAQAVQGRVLTWLYEPGAGKTSARVLAKVARAVLSVDPVGAAGREQRAVAGRFVRPFKAVEDGMVAWEARLPAAESVQVWERVVGLAEAAKHEGDTRGVDARRADVLLDLLLGRPVATPDGRPVGGPDGRPVGGSGGQFPDKVWRTDVVVAASTLLGADAEPGELLGWGPITARTARHLAGLDGRVAALWRRMLTDPQSGIVTDYGTTRYRPTRTLADFVRARDGRCIAPGCRVPASRADLDHVRNSPAGPSPRPDPGGATADWNLGSACPSDHRIKTRPGWKLTSPIPGMFTWTTPTGHTYQRHPEPPLERPHDQRPPPF